MKISDASGSDRAILLDDDPATAGQPFKKSALEAKEDQEDQEALHREFCSQLESSFVSPESDEGRSEENSHEASRSTGDFLWIMSHFQRESDTPELVEFEQSPARVDLEETYKKMADSTLPATGGDASAEAPGVDRRGRMPEPAEPQEYAIFRERLEGMLPGDGITERDGYEVKPAAGAPAWTEAVGIESTVPDEPVRHDGVRGIDVSPGLVEPDEPVEDALPWVGLSPKAGEPEEPGIELREPSGRDAPPRVSVEPGKGAAEESVAGSAAVWEGIGRPVERGPEEPGIEPAEPCVREPALGRVWTEPPFGMDVSEGKRAELSPEKPPGERAPDLPEPDVLPGMDVSPPVRPAITPEANAKRPDPDVVEPDAPFRMPSLEPAQTIPVEPQKAQDLPKEEDIPFRTVAEPLVSGIGIMPADEREVKPAVGAPLWTEPLGSEQIVPHEPVRQDGVEEMDVSPGLVEPDEPVEDVLPWVGLSPKAGEPKKPVIELREPSGRDAPPRVSVEPGKGATEAFVAGDAVREGIGRPVERGPEEPGIEPAEPGVREPALGRVWTEPPFGMDVGESVEGTREKPLDERLPDAREPDVPPPGMGVSPPVRSAITLEADVKKPDPDALEPDAPFRMPGLEPAQTIPDESQRSQGLSKEEDTPFRKVAEPVAPGIAIMPADEQEMEPAVGAPAWTEAVGSESAVPDEPVRRDGVQEMDVSPGLMEPEELDIELREPSGRDAPPRVSVDPGERAAEASVAGSDAVWEGIGRPVERGSEEPGIEPAEPGVREPALGRVWTEPSFGMDVSEGKRAELSPEKPPEERVPDLPEPDVLPGMGVYRPLHPSNTLEADAWKPDARSLDAPSDIPGLENVEEALDESGDESAITAMSDDLERIRFSMRFAPDQVQMSGDKDIPQSHEMPVEIREVVSRILVSDPQYSNKEEVRIVLQDSFLEGTEIRVAREGDGVKITIVTDSSESYEFLSQQQEPMGNELKDKLDRNVQVSVELTESGREQQNEGRSRQRRSVLDEWET